MTRAKLFRNGQIQAVRLPREFALPGREVFVRRVGNAVLLVPSAHPWAGFEASLGQFTDDFMDERGSAPGRMLVTNNTRDFARVPGLTLENWAED